MGKSSKAPTPPDPKQTAAAQTGSNVSTAIANANLGFVNQDTPYGSLNYDQTGSYSWTDPSTGSKYTVPRFTATQTLSPQQQQVSDLNQQADINLAQIGADQSQRISDHLAEPFQLSASSITAPDLQNNLAPTSEIQTSFGPDDGYSEDRKRVEDALLARMNPQLDRDRDNLTTSLANRGIKAGSEAYHMAMQDFGRASNDARYGAILNAGQEQNRLAALDQSQAAFGNQAQAQQFAQNGASAEFANNANQGDFANRLQLQGVNDQRDTFNRNQPLHEIAALLSGSQVTSPHFMPTTTPQLPNTDIASLIQKDYQARLANHNAAQQQRGQMFGQLGSLGSAFLLSDERAKTDIQPIGKLKGEKVYSFRYKGQPQTHIGVMAQDVEKRHPDAVATGPDGLKRVDYGTIFGAHADV